MSMTNNDHEASVAKKALGLSDFGIGVLSEPTFTPKPNRVEIWRYNENTLTVARSDGSAWNAADTTFSVRLRANGRRIRRFHDGFWNSEHMKFVPADTFSDGTPVALYDGLAPEDEEAVLWAI